MKKNIFLSLFFCTSLICYAQNQPTKGPSLILDGANTQSPQMSIYQEYENNKSSLKIDLGKNINRRENIIEVASGPKIWAISGIWASVTENSIEYNSKEDIYNINLDTDKYISSDDVEFWINHEYLAIETDYCLEFLYTNTHPNHQPPLIGGIADRSFIKELVINGKNIHGDLNSLWNSGISVDSNNNVATSVKVVFKRRYPLGYRAPSFRIHKKMNGDIIKATLGNISLTRGSTINTLEVNGNLKVNGEIIEAASLFKKLSEYKLYKKLYINHPTDQVYKEKLVVEGEIYAKELTIDGIIRAKGLKVEPTGWADFVFDEDYELPSLKQVKDHIVKNKRLLDMPSEQQVKNEGVDIANMQARLLQKIEELTLYVIDEKNKNEDLVRRAEYLEDILTKMEE